jgi:hypothetical protein
VYLDTRSTRRIWISAPLALAAALSACEPQSADEASNGATESELASNNGLAGHFKLINKLSGNAMEVPAGNNTAGTLAESSPYNGTSNQDWDIVAVPQN